MFPDNLTLEQRIFVARRLLNFLEMRLNTPTEGWDDIEQDDGYYRRMVTYCYLYDEDDYCFHNQDIFKNDIMEWCEYYGILNEIENDMEVYSIMETT